MLYSVQSLSVERAHKLNTRKRIINIKPETNCRQSIESNK